MDDLLEANDPNAISFTVITASNDQRLKTWQILVDLSGSGVERVKVQREGNVYSNIADVACMELVPHTTKGKPGRARKAALAGIGIETWDLNRFKTSGDEASNVL